MIKTRTEVVRIRMEKFELDGLYSLHGNFRPSSWYVHTKFQGCHIPRGRHTHGNGEAQNN